MLLALTATNARADTLPKEVLGKWCHTSVSYNATYNRGSCKTRDGTMTVKPDSVTYEEAGCDFTSVNTRIQTWYEHTNHGLKETKHKVYEVKSKCSGEGENWSETLFLNPYPANNTLDHESFNDNELPFSFLQDQTTFQDKTTMMCKDRNGELYFEMDNCGDGIGLSFEKDRYTITKSGESIGFCRIAAVKTVWDPNIGVATKTMGGPVSYITAQCPKATKTLKLYSSKGSWYLEDKGK